MEPHIGSFDLDVEDRTRRVDKPDPNERPRKPWLALLLGVLCTPIAFAYVGRLGWLIAIYVAIVAIMVGMGRSGLVQSVAGAWALLGFLLLICVGAILIPWMVALASESRHYRLKWYNRWYVYLFLAVALSVPLAYFTLNKQQFCGFGIYRVPSGSMAPTIMPGDQIVADTRPATVAALKPGDLAILKSDLHGDKIFVKRIVAGPGQHVHINFLGVYVDGKLHQYVYAQGDDAMSPRGMVYPDVHLGPDQYYVMGDNRSNSIDSRTEGPVPRRNLIGKATTIYYAKDLERTGKLE